MSAHEIEHMFGLDPKNINMIDVLESSTIKPFIIPIVGLVIGAVMMGFEKVSATVATVGKLVLYFGAQSFMNIFMGWVFRTRVTLPKGFPLPNGEKLGGDLHGCPIGFALTALQQVISFFLFIILFACLYKTPWKIVPKTISTKGEWLSICIFGSVFALNIALNNFSLGYISVAVNLIIRSCLPLTTFLSQQGLAVFGLYPMKEWKIKEISLMVIGVFCAATFTLAKIMGSQTSEKEKGHAALGVVMCIASLLCGSVNLALAGVLGEMKLSVYDTVAYMSVPATVFLLPLILFVQNPLESEWPAVFGVESATNWQILMKVWAMSPSTIGVFVLSGVFSFAYNIIQFSIVHTLSPSATAFGGNFNKAALVLMTLILPFLQTNPLPGAPYIYVIWLAVLGNVAAFSTYSYLQILDKQAKAKASEDGKDGKLINKKSGDSSSDSEALVSSTEEGA